MVNNYLKVLSRIKMPDGQPGAIVRKRYYFRFDDSSAVDTMKARTSALVARDEIKRAGLVPVVSLYRPCSLITGGDGEITLIGEFVEFGDGR